MTNEVTVAASAIQWQFLLGSTPLEITATLSAVLGVFLIARQNILGWPLGIVWAGISFYLAYYEWQLVSDAILYASYIPIQCYCWWVWARRGADTETKPFVPDWLPRKTQGILVIAAIASVALWANGISALAHHVSWIPEPSLLWRDSITTVLNYFAQFLQARKRMENWIGWLVVNILGIHIYWVKDAPIYSIQYAFFLGLGIYGWIQWQKSRTAHTA
jgi:nicotinamide mononucleotide transporter